MKVETIGDVPAVESTSACVVYYADTGRIAHVHHLIRLRGADRVSDKQLEAAALEMAGRHHDVTRLRVLRMEQLEIDPRVEYQVDVVSKRLIEVKQDRLKHN